MEVFDTINFKFIPQKYRGENKPVGRQGHCAIIIN